MRIGITTWHEGPNAGTFLQLYGLYNYLTSRGHSVKVIDYKRNSAGDLLPRGVRYYLNDPIGLVRRKLVRSVWQPRNIMSPAFNEDIQERDLKFQEAYSNLEFTGLVRSDCELHRLNNDFDAFVVGSDQVWNASMLNRRYFLDYVEADKIKAAYAPSMGSGLVLPKQRSQFKTYLSSFDYISVREKLLADILSEELVRKVEHVLDPSMLVPKSEYLQMALLPDRYEAGTYVLCYFTPNSAKQKEQVVSFAKQRGLKIVVMAMHPEDYAHDDVEVYAAAGPREFLGLIANAAAVFTSSFHCTIFSILFNKDLYVFQQYAYTKASDINQRIKEQLDTYGISSRSICWGGDMDVAIKSDIDYAQVNKIFEDRLMQSKRFINQFA